MNKKMRQLLTTLLIIITTANAYAQTFDYEYAGATLEYEVTSEGDKTVSVNGFSVAHVTELEIPETLSIEQGKTETLSVTVLPSHATNKSVTWSSNSTSVATVSSSGVVTALSEGTAIITVRTTNGGLTATCTITVTKSTVDNAINKPSSTRAYPNPTTGIVTVTGLKVGTTIKIYTATGTQVATHTAHDEKTTLDISALPNGLYYLNIEEQTLRLIKK